MHNLIQNISYSSENQLLRELRHNGLCAFNKQGIPNAKIEAWKYTRLRDLLVADYAIAPYNHSYLKNPLSFDCYCINICNGYIVGTLPNNSNIKVKTLADASLYLGKNAQPTQHAFVALNDYYLENGAYITISGTLDKPLLLNYHIFPEDKNYLCNIRNVIVCSDSSKAEIIECYNYSGEIKSRYLNNIVNEIFIEKDAILSHYKFQNESFKSNHIAFNGVSVSQGGNYNSFCLQKGANISRNETEVHLNATEAQVAVNAAYVMNGWATLDTTTNIYHHQPHTNSSQLVKGVIGGEAKGVFQGKIHIAPDAVCTNGTQLHKAVLLSENAEVDVKPELEIFADDVKCSHGAACGELDKEQLFYMQARGIGIEDARQILIDAYLNDVLELITNDKIREWFKNLV